MFLTGFLHCLFLLTLAAAERFSLEQASKIVSVAYPQISPDGRIVVIAVTRANLKENRYDTELFQVDIATKARKILTRRRASQHRLSPDGKHLAFLVPVDGKSQIFVMPMDGGEALQVSYAATAVQNYAWRPDGRAFAYIAAEEAPKREGDEKANRSFDADVNYLSTESARASHLWLVPFEGGDAKRLTSGEWSAEGQLHWSPDGKRVGFLAQPLPGARYWAERASRALDVETGVVSPLSGRKGLERLVGFASDGKHFAYSYPRDGDTRFVDEVFLASTDGTARSLSSDMDANVFANWLPGGRSLLLFTRTGTDAQMWLHSLEGQRRRLDTGNVNFFDVSLSEQGKLALVATEPGRPSELYVMDSPDSPPRRLTDFNAHIASLDLGRQESIRWRGPDNFDVDGILTYPPGYDSGRLYPLVLVIHGGPRGASSMGFNPRSQWLASHGWIVFEPNYRGSSNLGNAFQAAIWNDAGAGPGRDVMAGVDLLIKKGIADPARMAVSGWSYGGYMTAWLLGNYPDRWRAGVAGAAVTDHIDQYSYSDIHSFVATYYGGSPFNDPKRFQAYRDQAPITYASRIKAPTLVLCDTGDQRVPITESYMLYHAMRDNGVKTRFIAYPVSGHVPTDPIHERDVNRRWAEWIKEHLDAVKPESDPAR